MGIDNIKHLALVAKRVESEDHVNGSPPEPPDMEITERVTRLEVISENTVKAIDRLDRTMADMRSDMDRKFTWMIGTQIATLLAVVGILAKAAHIF